MRSFLVRRLTAIPLTLLGVSVLVFLATTVLPGDVGRTILGREASDASVAALDHQLGLDQPVTVRYLRWLGRFLTGDWGDSYTLHQPVTGLVATRLENSATLAVYTFVLLLPVALTLGLAAGVRHDTLLDRLVSGLSLAFGATPEFVTGVVLLVVFAVDLKWFPASALPAPGDGPLLVLWHLTLPAVSLVVLCTGYVARHVRASTVAVVEGPYVRAARLRGTSPAKVVLRHVLRNATVPATSALGVQLQFLLGGLVVVELLFNYPGVGALLLQAAIDKDLPTLQATAMILGALYMAVVLVADLAYRLLDPRVRVAAA
ncbi:ABC transporter permease [Actinoplanes siamensis]|uniref:Peptide ABC transporter permease n=1 Tax=Actinoplanes siamensis TaxID=1223317 RepID=A0A919TPC8_9ACTN|nr:ABC transporter permease [Actinoplanes siamensis]GIF09038.1 peptide ABC transporter permease [Actinoplanes siamensis]